MFPHHNKKTTFPIAKGHFNVDTFFGFMQVIANSSQLSQPKTHASQPKTLPNKIEIF